MLITYKTYRIVDNKNDTLITIEEDGGIYQWKVRNADGEELSFALTDLNMADVFEAIKDMGDFV